MIGIRGGGLRAFRCKRVVRCKRIVRHFANKHAVIVPKMGESVSEGTIVEWKKDIGQRVNVDDPVAVIETDKVAVDVNSTVRGTLVEKLVEVDENVEVGQEIAKIDLEGEQHPEEDTGGLEEVQGKFAYRSVEEEPTEKESKPSKMHGSQGIASLTVPKMGESVTEGTIVEWVKKVGDYVEVDDVVVILETDKVTIDVRATEAGIIQEHVAGVGDTLEVGNELAKIDTSASKPKSTHSKSSEKQETKSEPVPAKESSSSKREQPASQGFPMESLPSSSSSSSGSGRGERRVKMNRMRIRIAERLKMAQNTAAMLTTFQECDMTELINLRKKLKESFEKKHGVKLGFMSAFVRAATEALQDIPAVNGFIDTENNEIVYRDYCDISVAVASPQGLVVPVLRNTENMTFKDIELKIAEYAQKAKTGSLSIDEMTGGTFTISNGGIFGSLMSTPILNMPQSAILGMHATKMRPVVVDGQVVARPMMYLALSYDHRLIDGREAVTFLKIIAEKVTDPNRMLLEL